MLRPLTYPILIWIRCSRLYRCLVEVTVELSGQLLPGKPRRRTLKLDQPLTVRDVAVLLELDDEEVGLAVINGIQSEMEDIVPAGSRVCFFPYLSGG